MKTSQCVICGEEVTRRKSYSVGNGRACRIHEEAQEKFKELTENAQRDKEARQAKKVKEKEHKRTLSLKPCCWICHSDGVRQDEFYMRWLIETTKYEIVEGSLNIFDPEEMKKAVGELKDERCLFYVEWSGGNKKIGVPIRVYELIQMSEQMFGTANLLVCQDCCDKKGFRRMIDQSVEKMTFDDLVKQSVAYETIVQPVVEELAKSELEVS